jgi:Rieske Fe-S protein
MEERRGFIQWVLGGGVAASLASFLYPVFRFVMPPEIPEAPVNEVNAGKASSFIPDSGKIVKFGTKPVILIHTKDDQWRAFSAICTHLNCTVQFQAGKDKIWCACHNALYDLNGAVVSGPPPRPLDVFDVRLKGDDVVIGRRT